MSPAAAGTAAGAPASRMAVAGAGRIGHEHLASIAACGLAVADSAASARSWEQTSRANPAYASARPAIGGGLLAVGRPGT